MCGIMADVGEQQASKIPVRARGARLRGCDVDQPRNLAKSVTVA
ncbi:MAG: hypothetical protein AAFV53_19155 [Myxococcota bacterium]